MPDKRQHRGPHPADAERFAEGNLDRLRTATAELSWLLSRGYAMRSGLQIVGDRHALVDRQRLAISRAACSDVQRDERAARCLPVESLRNSEVFIDGFNLIITIEAALGGGVLLQCRDGCIRDLSSVHGSYRSVAETDQAMALIGTTLEAMAPREVHWLLDKPVSNSGRLAQNLRELAAAKGWPWTVEVCFNPDAVLSAARGIVVTSDSAVLDRGVRWVNFNEHLLHRIPAPAWIVPLI